jgi:hypothetical protein
MNDLASVKPAATTWWRSTRYINDGTLTTATRTMINELPALCRITAHSVWSLLVGCEV